MSLTLDDLRPLLTEDRELKYKLKGFTGRLRVVVGDLTADLVADNGTITGLEPGSDEEARLSVVVPADIRLTS